MNELCDLAKDDLLRRGYSRRQMMRAAMMIGGAAAAAVLDPELAWAQDDRPRPAKIQIGLNEFWTGPMAPGVAATAAVASRCNRYWPADDNGRMIITQLVKTISQVENVPEDHISPWPGSNIVLARAVLAYCSPTRGAVQADPTYGTVGGAAKFLGVPLKSVPLKADYSHDVKAMLAADPNAGVYYVVNPNNPTGTMTPMADIEWLVANKPAGSVVVIDEAYIHFAPDYPNGTANHLAIAGKDVIVARTFSKIFGMAGMRLGYFMGRPDIIEKIKSYDGGNLSQMLPIPSVACGIASLTASDLIAQRRKDLVETRAMTVDFLSKRNVRVIGPSHANMLMVDWKTKTAREMLAAFRAQGVEIAGPRWPVWPNVSRITIGSKDDMRGFFEAFDKVVVT
ncbi:MAG: aminotransferase class I/II-fold pyridoxal phosphate-dependent enzyme [Proteobacteria bacterium]|nr:aminotransferase class I/II-fold pyridoxal phosphate-dependent enzyme [Pseudomonadota bacterium]